MHVTTLLVQRDHGAKLKTLLLHHVKSNNNENCCLRVFQFFHTTFRPRLKHQQPRPANHLFQFQRPIQPRMAPAVKMIWLFLLGDTVSTVDLLSGSQAGEGIYSSLYFAQVLYTVLCSFFVSILC